MTAYKFMVNTGSQLSEVAMVEVDAATEDALRGVSYPLSLQSGQSSLLVLAHLTEAAQQLALADSPDVTALRKVLELTTTAARHHGTFLEVER